MGVVEELEALRQDCDGCRLVLYADLTVSLPLVASSADVTHRNVLEGLCAEASAAFASADEGLDGADTVVTLAADALHIHLRSLDGTEALSCQATAALDVDRYLDAAHGLLARLSDPT